MSTVLHFDPNVQENRQMAPPQDLGAHVRALRESLGLSQRALARLAGVTNATISNVEQNAVSPSVASLRKIVRAMGHSLADFFTREDPQHSRRIYRAADLVELAMGPVSLRLVATGDAKHTLHMLHERYAPGADTSSEMLSHPGEEAGLVIEGTLTLTLGDEQQTLGPGDAYQFPSTIPHRFENRGTEPCVLVSACTPANFSG
ncbi:MAG: transcriptional regulator with XRE-family HTH domain [Myxococcota bacterium]|jgi:transcriptional regulator with XRE-family HTH domain